MRKPPLFAAALTLVLVHAVLLPAGLAANDQAEAFRAQAAEKANAATASGTTTLEGRNGWLFFGPELRHVAAGRFWGEAAAAVSRATKPEHADPLAAILDFKAQLDAAGIALLLVPVPPKVVIYPEHLVPFDASSSDGPNRIDVVHEEFYALLRERGVDVVDLVPTFLAHKDSADLYCRQDTHWSGAGCVLAAEAIAAGIRQQAWYENASRRDFATESARISLTGDLARELESPPAPEELEVRSVGTRAGDTLEPVAPDPASPIILLGDSHNLVFHAGGDMHAIGAGLPDQLAKELGLAVDLVAVRGSGATPARINLLRRARAPDYLAGKKVVIWCFAAREFTESSGWQRVPIVPAFSDG